MFQTGHQLIAPAYKRVRRGNFKASDEYFSGWFNKEIGDKDLDTDACKASVFVVYRHTAHVLLWCEQWSQQFKRGTTWWNFLRKELSMEKWRTIQRENSLTQSGALRWLFGLTCMLMFRTRVGSDSYILWILIFTCEGGINKTLDCKPESF